jgi:hypothetical protein
VVRNREMTVASAVRRACRTARESGQPMAGLALAAIGCAVHQRAGLRAAGCRNPGLVSRSHAVGTEVGTTVVGGAERHLLPPRECRLSYRFVLPEPRREVATRGHVVAAREPDR